MKHEYAQVTMDGKHWGLINKSGQYVIPPDYQQIYQWNDGILRLAKRSSDFVVQDGAWENRYNGEIYFINHKGEFINQSSFDYALDFSEGLAAVVKNGKWGALTSHRKHAYFTEHGGQYLVEYDWALNV